MNEKSNFQPGYTRSDLWEWICELSVEAFTDSRSGSCMFDSPEYIEAYGSMYAASSGFSPGVQL